MMPEDATSPTTPLTAQTQLTAVRNVWALPLNITKQASVCTYCFLETCWVVGQRGIWWTNTDNVRTVNLFCIPKASSFLFSPQQIENYICNLISEHSDCAFLGAINCVWIGFYISFLYIYYRIATTEKKLKIKEYQTCACFFPLLHKRK